MHGLGTEHSRKMWKKVNKILKCGKRNWGGGNHIEIGKICKCTRKLY